MESKAGLMSRDSSEGLDAKELASLSDVREEAIATQAATEPEPKPEPKHHLSNVPFTQWPMGASPSDRQVGQDDAGNPLFEMQFNKNTYIVKRDPDQRTPREKLKDAVVTGQKAVTNYLQGDDYIPSASEVAEFGKAIAVTAYETLEGAMEGRGTMGDVFGMAPTMAVAGMGFKVPKGALRTFGGKGMDLDEDQTSRFADARSKFKEALNTVDVNDPAAFYDLNKKIWRATGWFINPRDKQWRYEIDDKPATISFDNLASDRNITTKELTSDFNMGVFASGSSKIKLSEIFSHEKLFERYPHLKDMDVRFYSRNTGELGTQSPGENRISINTKAVDINNIPELKSTILHEIQHAIQDYEGFNIGANNDFIPDEVTKDLVDKVDTMRHDLRMKRVSILTRVRPRLKEFFNYLPKNQQPNFSAEINRVFKDVKRNDVTPEEINKRLEEATRIFMENHGIRDYGKIGEDLLKLSKNTGEDYAAKYLTRNMEFKFYRGAGGEIESRLVEARQYLGSNTIFPLDQEQLMLKREGSSSEYEGKVDKAGDSLYRVRSPKLGESDVYFDPLESRNTIMQRVYKKEGKDPNKVDRDVINKTNEIYVKNILKGHPELKKITNLKENDKVIIDGNEYEFKKFTVNRESKKFLPETGEIIQRPQAKGQLLRDVIVPRLSLIATDSSLPPEVRFLIPSLAEFLQKTDLVDKPFDIQKLSKPPKSKKSIVGQMKSLFGYDEGGLTTSLRPFTREDSIKESNKRKNELKQLGDLEFRADLDKQLSWNPLARLGYQPDKTKVLKTDSPSFYAAYDTMVFDPDSTDESLQDSAIRMGFPEEEAKRLKAGDVYVTSDTAFNPVFAHEYTHVGLEKVFKLAKKDPKAFKEKYGKDAYGLIVTSTDDYIRDEYLTELFDDLTTKFNSLGIGDSLKVSDKFPNKSIAFTTDSDRYDDKFIDTRELFQESIKNKDTKTTKEDVTTFNENLKGIFGIMDAAQDILTEQGEPPKAKRKELSFYEQFKKALGFNEGGLVDTRKGIKQ